MSKSKATYQPNKIAVFEMPDGSKRRIRGTNLPAFASEALDGGKSKGAEAMLKCVACSKNASGIVKLLQMLEER